MKRRYVRLLSWMLVGTLLYGQMAIAAYACPGQVSPAGVGVSAASIHPTLSPVDDTVAATSSTHAGDCAGMSGQMDPSASKLCADHCNYGHQSDQTSNLTLPTVLLTLLYVAQPTESPSVPLQPAAELSALAEASPPLAILHCRFRI
jgi:hypothetical protein